MNCSRLTLVVPFLTLGLIGCGESVPPDFLGSAVVESDNYLVASTVQGSLVSVSKREGDKVVSDELIAVIDTVPMVLRLSEIEATSQQLDAQIQARRADVEAVKAEVAGTKRELDRIKSLAEKGSAPRQQADELETRYEASLKKLQSAQASLRALIAQKIVIASQEALVRDQISRAYVKAPAPGIIQTKFKSLGEIATPSQPIYEIGRFDTMYVDFFVSQPMLGELKIGQPVVVKVDVADDKQVSVPAVISWISDEAEFTPKNIQTRELRNELVFRVRAMAANRDGILKRGLPVEVWKSSDTSKTAPSGKD